MSHNFREFLNQNLPAFGEFEIHDESAPLNGRVEFDESTKRYKLCGTIKTNIKGFEGIWKAMWDTKPLEHIRGEIFGLGFADLINPKGKLVRLSSSSLAYYDILFDEMIIRELTPANIPKHITSFRLSDHYISNMWFGNSGFKQNKDLDQEKKLNTVVYEVQKDVVLLENSDLSITLQNHYYEKTRYEVHEMIEEKILKIQFTREQKITDIKSIAEKLSRFLQFVSGRFEPFIFLTYSSNRMFFRHYLNLTKVGDTRDVFTKKGFLVPYEMIKENFNIVLKEWLRLESDIPYTLDRYSSACNHLMSNDIQHSRLAFIDMCSALDAYYQKEMKLKKKDLHKVIKKLLEEIDHPKVQTCFRDDFHLKIAATRNSFIHDLEKSDTRYRQIIPSIKITKYATKLKVLFEYLMLKNHFRFPSEDIYRRIANPWPNRLYLDELT